MTVRCKMTLESVIPQQWGGSQATFRCIYDPDICAEDVGFQKATPNGYAHLTIDNPKALEQLVIGASYYFDMTPVPVPAPPQ
jgi:hypothetical protein